MWILTHKKKTKTNLVIQEIEAAQIQGWGPGIAPLRFPQGLLWQDWNQEIYLSGEIRWAPFGSTEAEELLLEGYKVSAIAAWM